MTRFFCLPVSAAASVIALSGMGSPILAADRGYPAHAYSCTVFGGDGKAFDTFDVAMKPRANEGFEYDVEIASPTNGSLKAPTTAKALASGRFEIVSRPAGPNGEPPSASSPRTGIRLVFEDLRAGSNGYAVIYKDGVSPHFEVAGYYPVATGICTPSGVPGS